MYGQRRSPLLLWTSAGFMGLSINNALLCVDLVLVPAIDLSAWRAVAGSAASLVLAGGLLWERRWW